jgi:hypothetical protein
MAMARKSLAIALYACEPAVAKFYGFHMNGTQHAAFCNAYAAHSWFRGLREPDYFYVTDAQGERVQIAMNSYGHAYVVSDGS